MGVVLCGEGVEKIRNRFAVLALENNINQFLVFGVSELDVSTPVPYIEVTETDFQTGKDKTLPILNTLAVLAYRRAPFICNPRQAPRTGFQLDQVV